MRKKREEKKGSVNGLRQEEKGYLRKMKKELKFNIATVRPCNKV